MVHRSDAGLRFIARGLNQEVVDARLVATCRERRHPSVCVEADGADGRFAKQALGDLSRSRLARERRVVGALTRIASLVDILPQLSPGDGDIDELTFRLEVGAIDLRARSFGEQYSPSSTTFSLGRALQALHNAGHATIPGLDETSGVDLRLHLPSTDDLASSTPATISMTEILQRADGVAETLERLAANWRSEWLIHGDLRFDNVLVSTDPLRPIVVVDWEDAGRGDWAWDVGTVIGEIFSTWLYTGGATLSTPWARPPEPLRLWTRQFLQGYGNVGMNDEDLRRVIEYTGAWLIQLAAEHCLVSAAVPAAAILRLQLAQNIFLRPWAAADLIGIGR